MLIEFGSTLDVYDDRIIRFLVQLDVYLIIEPHNLGALK